MIGAVVLQLKALNNAVLPISHGRLLHAAFLDYIRSVDPEVSALMHNEQKNRFALNLLKLAKNKRKKTLIEKGDKLWWRICVLETGLLRLLYDIKKGTVLRIGCVVMIVEEVFIAQEQHIRAGAATLEEIETCCRSLPFMKKLTIHFNSPTAFRYYNYDYPFPKPELVFGSLTENWNNCSNGMVYNVDSIKKIAAERLIPEKWTGSTKRIRNEKNRDVTGFTGTFNYKLELLPKEYQTIFLTLAEFGVFCGVGRLTGQGMGEIDIEYE